LLALDVVVVVDVNPAVALERLVEFRGMPRHDAEARMAAQATREQRLEGADLVVDNSGDLVQLQEEVGRVWDELQARAAAKASDGRGPDGAPDPLGSGQGAG
ncbi:MAG TPA: dephospho-CoA kinase, partial [Acidimicrobiales bacterium]|nr:dephospho-CoA kinase [Acidimicrobiales bacterium]